eukprot:UN27930
MIECDVSATSDGILVCRHSHCDLHYTTDVLLKPELASKCTEPFTPATDTEPANAKCCTTDFTLEEFQTLCGTMENAINKDAKTVDEYTYEKWRPTIYEAHSCGTVMTHAESIQLFDQLGVDMIPELKRMSDEGLAVLGWSQDDYGAKIVQDYLDHDISPMNVHLQSFYTDDIVFWLTNYPEFTPNVLYLYYTDCFQGEDGVIDYYDDR